MNTLHFSTIFITLTFMLGFTSGCMMADPFCIEGQGEMYNETFIPEEAFSRIVLNIDATVYLTQGNDIEIYTEAQDNILGQLELSIRRGWLEINFEECVASHNGINIYITLPMIEKLTVNSTGQFVGKDLNMSTLELEINGSGAIKLDDITAPNIKSRIEGSGGIYLSGVESEKHNIDILGTGEVDAYSIPTQEVYIDVLASGRCLVNVISLLDVKIYGSGNIYYIGTPEIRTEITGTGSVQNAN